MHEIGKNDSVNAIQSPQILSMVFEIQANGTVIIENTNLVNGQLRKKANPENFNQEGDLLISFLDENKKACALISLENPLRKKVEYSENFKILKAETIELDSAPFSIRVQFQDCFKYILVEEIVNSTNFSKQILLESTLNLNVYE